MTLVNSANEIAKQGDCAWSIARRNLDLQKRQITTEDITKEMQRIARLNGCKDYKEFNAKLKVGEKYNSGLPSTSVKSKNSAAKVNQKQTTKASAPVKAEKNQKQQPANKTAEAKTTNNQNKTYSKPYVKNAIRDPKVQEFANASIPKDKRNKILAYADAAGKKYNIDPRLILSVMNTESTFDPNAKSNKGAAGLMQLMPVTAKAYGATNRYDMKQNIMAGANYLKYLDGRYGGNLDLMLKAYNGGPFRKTPYPKESVNFSAKVRNTYRNLS